MSVPLILFILVFAAFSAAEPLSYGRSLIVKDLLHHQHVQQELSSSIPCVKSFLKKYVKVRLSTLIMFLDSDDDVHEFASTLFSTMDLKFAYVQPSESRFGPLERSSDAIVFMPNASSIEHDFRAPKPCTRDCLFFCILTTIFQDEETFLDQVDTVVQSMWAQRIAKVVVLAKVGDSVLAAGSRTFRPQQLCIPSAAIILDKCENDSWNKLLGLRTPSLNDCILNVAYYEESPFVIVKNGTKELFGFEGRLIEEVLRKQPIDRNKVEWINNATYEEIGDMVLYKNTMADVVIGGILQQATDDIAYSSPYDVLKVVWLIPKVPKVSLKGLITPFGAYVWGGIGASLLLGGVIKTFLSRDLSWLDIFALIIGSSLPGQPTKLSSRILFLSWNIFGLFLTQLYVDSLADQLINASDLKIGSTRELINSSFKIGGVAAHANFFDDKTDEIARQVREKFVTFDKDTYMKLYKDVLSGRNNSVALVIVMNSSHSDSVETLYAYALTTDPICSFPLVFATWQGFPELRLINRNLRRLNDMGILDYLIDMALLEDIDDKPNVDENEKLYAPLRFPHFVPALLLLLVGSVCSFILLVFEIIFYPSKYLE